MNSFSIQANNSNDHLELSHCSMLSKSIIDWNLKRLFRFIEKGEEIIELFWQKRNCRKLGRG